MTVHFAVSHNLTLILTPNPNPNPTPRKRETAKWELGRHAIRCCALKFLHALEIDQALLAHTSSGAPPPQKKWLFSFAGQKLKMSRTEKRSNLGVLMAAGVTSGV